MTMSASLRQLSPSALTRKTGFKNAVLIVGNEPEAVKDQAIIIEKNKIVFVGSLADAEKNHKDCQWIDAKGWMISPGLINCHTHVAMSFFRGLSHGHEDMLGRFIFPAEKSLTEDVVQSLSYSAIFAGLRAGVTCFNDHYYFSEAIGRAFEEFGVRAFLGETLQDLGGPLPNRVSIKDVEEMIDTWKFSDRILPVIAPHATDTVSRKLLTESAKVARKRNLPLHIHVSQTHEEFKIVQKRESMSPVVFARDCGAVYEQSLLVHLVSAEPSDFDLIVKENALGVVCPVSQILYENLVPLKSFMRLNENMAVATDCAASNDHFDVLAEAKALALLGRHSGLDKDFFSASKLMKMLTTAPAKALGLEKKLGMLSAGAKADLVFIDCDLAMQPMMQPLENLIYSSNTSHIRHVLVDGRWVLWNENPTLVNLNEKTEQYAEAVKTIHKRAGLTT